MKALGYFRARASPRRESGIIGQQQAFLDYCRAHGLEVAATFGAEEKEEDAFGQLIAFLRRPQTGLHVVLTQSPAVLANEPVAAAARLFQLERLGAELRFIEDDATDPLQQVLRNWSGSDDDRRDKVRDALRRKAVRGEVLGRPPYGYRVGPHNRLELVEEEALVVRYIFRLYLEEGLGIRMIARRLNEEGLRTRRNRPWSMVSIRDMLRNRAYVGTYQRLGVRVPGTHAAVVTPEEFRRVQERLEDRRTNYSPRNVSGFLLSGMAVCGSCGNRMIGVSRKQTWKRRRDGSEQVASYRYYQCESRTNQGLCSYNTQRAQDLEQAVRNELAALDPKRLAASGHDAAVIQHWREETVRLRERLQQLDRKLAREVEEAAAGHITLDVLRREGLALSGERERVEDELRDAEWRAEHYSSASERRRTRGAALKLLVNDWDKLTLAEKQPLLRELIEVVRVREQGQVELILRP